MYEAVLALSVLDHLEASALYSQVVDIRITYVGDKAVVNCLIAIHKITEYTVHPNISHS